MVQKIIKMALAAGVKLYLEKQKLKFTAPKGALTPELKAAIGEHKEQIIAYLHHSAERPVTNAISIRPNIEHRPLSLSQSRLWFLHQLGEGNSSEYNIFTAFDVEGQLDLDVVRLALREIIIRHEVLRCGYYEQDGQAQQFLHHNFEVPLQVLDFSHLTPLDYHAQLQDVVKAEAYHSFDLSSDIMLRVTCVNRGTGLHCLLFSMHHIASDGWSIEVLSKEFLELYQKISTGQVSSLTPLSIQYADYAHWQTQRMDEQTLAQQLDFWREYLFDLPDIHNLPLDRPRPKQQSFTSKTMQVPLGLELTEQLGELAKAHSVTLFILLQTAFAYILSRFSGEQDIVMATPVAGREREEVQSLIGCFLNTVILRSTIPQAGDFWQYLAANKNQIQQAFGHQEVPFDQVVDALQPIRSLAYNPLAQVKFVLQNYQQSEFSLPDLQIRPLKSQENSVRYDLDLTVFEEHGVLQLDWNYKCELFNEESIVRLSDSMVQLLSALPTHQSGEPIPSLVSKQVSQALLAMGTGKEQQQINLPISQQILQQALLTPENIAVRSGDNSLSYSELVQKAKNLAWYLEDQEIGLGDHVAILLPKEVDLLIALLAVQLSGATYVPLDKSSGEARLSGILKDVNAELLITQSNLMTLVSSEGCDVMLMDDCLDSDWLCEFEQASLTVPKLDDIAYLIYTSGSTGKPKGVEISQLGLLDYCAFANKYYYTSNLLGALLVTEPAFDISVPSLYLPLLNGDCVTLLSEEDVIFELAAALMELQDNGVLLRMTPSHCHALLHILEGKTVNATCVLVIGGEALPQKLATALCHAFPYSQLFNHYGPSETVVGCCLYPLEVETLASFSQVPIGKPMTNTQLVVLDDKQQLQVLGGIGELWIGGVGVAKGYWQRAELNKQCFKTDVLNIGNSLRYYKSGDLVRWNCEGQLEFVGRNDQQIKIRGHRVELGEIDTQLSQCEGVQQTVTLLHENEENQYLVCYFVSSGDDAEQTQSILEHHAVTQLSPYMRPQYYVSVITFPLSRNGKINRRALPSPYTVKKPVLQAAQSITEVKLIEIFSDLLATNELTAASDFFVLGGHSLLAVRLINQVSKLLGKKLQLKDIFSHSCIKDLALFIDSSESELFEPIAVIDSDDSKPLSVAQQRLWLLTQIDTQQAQYNLPFAIAIKGYFDTDVAEKSLLALIARHQVLQMNILTHHGQPQLQPSKERFALSRVEVGNYTSEEQQHIVSNLQQQEIAVPFDLTKDVLLRGTYISRSDESGVLLLTTHHIATDGWSMNVLLRDFFALYNNNLHGVKGGLAEVEIQYSDYAAWQRDQLAKPAQAEQLNYWLEHLTDLDAVHQLPIYQARSKQQTFAGNNLQSHLSVKQLDGLKQLAVQHNVTLFMVLHALLSILISRHTQHQQVVIGTPVANRNHPQLDNLVGFFVNNLILKLDCDLSLSFKEVLAYVKQINLDALSRQTTPFELLVEKLAPERSLYCSPLFQIMLILDNTEAQQLNDAKLPFEFQPLVQQESVAKYELTWHAREDQNGLQFTVEYRTELFEAQYINALMGQFVQLVEGVTETAEQPCYRYDLLPASQRVYLTQRLNETKLEFNPDALLQDGIEAQSLANPHSTAAVFDMQSLTFFQLNEQADNVAAQLRRQGVLPGQLVGLCQERSLSMLVNLLAILKVGAAYVPLDPCYPAQRLNYIIHDSALAHLIITENLRPLFGNESAVKLHLVDALNPQESAEMVLNPVKCTADNLAYVIYTSGSSGQPKGVKVTHRNVINFFAAMDNALPATGHQDTWLASTSISFDISVLELFWSLRCGSKIIIQPDRPHAHIEDKLAKLGFYEYDKPLLEASDCAALRSQSSVTRYTSSLGGGYVVLSCTASLTEYVQAAQRGLSLDIFYQGSELIDLKDKVSAFSSQHNNEPRISLFISYGSADEKISALGQLKDREACVVELADFARIGIDDILVVGSKLPCSDAQLERTQLIQFLDERRQQYQCQADMMAKRFSQDWNPATLICNQHVSRLQSTPSFVRELLQSQEGRLALSQLDLLLVGGEALSDELAQQLYTLLPERVFNMYGPTECTVWSCVGAVTIDAVSIGKPVGNTRVYILDEYQQLAPLGAVGELCIAGEGVTPGYLHRSDLTQQRFVALPLLDSNERIYKTGDLARWNANGELICLGRNDEQVKVNGHRIELGEVERLLGSFTECEQVAVVKQSMGNSEQLVAFVVFVAEHRETDDWVQQWRFKLSTLAPSYLIPERIKRVDAFPLTPNGKIDKRSLANQVVAGSGELAAATTETEKKVMQHFQAVLEHTIALSIHDSFFTLGGHSLLSVRLVNELNAEFSSALTVRDIFKNSTVAALSTCIDNQKTAPYEMISARKHSEIRLPLSLQQQRLWFIDQLYEGQSAHYNMQVVLEVGQQFDLVLAQHVLGELILRHRTLRTKYQTLDGVVEQVIEPNPQFQITRLLLDETQAQSWSAICDIFTELALVPFNLQEQLPLRATYIKSNKSSYLMLCIHHIATDAWSMAILAEEFCTLYASACQNDESQLNELPIDYADYALWQQSHEQKEKIDQQNHYWLQQLNNLSELNSLPLDFSRGQFASHQCKTLTMKLDGNQFLALKQATLASDTTSFMYLHAILSVVICRYSGVDDIAIGTPVANRPRKELDNLVGLFVNTLVLRTDYNASDNFNEYLQHVKGVVVAALSHQETPFEWLVEQLSSKRSTSYNPLIQVLFNYQKANNDDRKNFDQWVKPIEFNNQQSKFELSLRAIEYDDHVKLEFDYDVSLFAEETMQRVVNSFGHVLSQTLSHPMTPLSKLSLTKNSADLAIQHGEINLDGRGVPLLDAFYQQQMLTPEATAIIDDGSNLSYRSLADKSAQLADYLRQQQLGHGSRIGLYLTRGPEIVIAIIAAFQINACFVPIDLSNQGDRLDCIIEDAELDIVLVTNVHSSHWQKKRCTVCELSISNWQFGEYSKILTPLENMPDAPAYIIYTSGSTGKPKGVEVAHRALVDYCQFALQNYYEEHLNGAFLATSYGFDISLPALLLPLMRGGFVNVSQGEDVLIYLANLLSGSGVGCLLLRLTPMHVRALLNLMTSTSNQKAHVFVIGGEFFPVSLLAELAHSFPNAVIYNHYGPSEAVIGCCIAQVSGRDFERTESLPIGYAMENTQLYLLDEAMQIVPKGVVGELYIAGQCLANGYLNRPELTEHNFVANPFKLGERLYRTGDLARHSVDNELHYVGRTDDQVKLHGFRIELGEVTQQLLALPEIKAAASLIVGEGEHRRLVSYVVRSELVKDETVLMQVLTRMRQNLPHYLCPAQLVDLPKLPLSANGKINKKALLSVTLKDAQPFAAATNELEKQLCCVWQQLLRLEQSPSIDSNFFDIGGNSLLVMTLSVELQKQFSCVIQIGQLFNYQTVRQQAELIEQLSVLLTTGVDNEEFEDEGVL
ncbi:non-ribosomal peptide synthetase [Pseudoalteromonas sp. MMG005]|uniref:non-ribosomal peptide synthetase n=1 Tax=Pseudoalteromonas sp. MMG005 TaxID=2822682 RepID=UPI001B3A426F|nr:non-ribosomal peptide synthetase [Pseudoalteromonas sp. MMG005]MBQ4844739.1 amino acid adenylation domain-containing protein [Pseudoalteromonas sp. MMG005]